MYAVIKQENEDPVCRGCLSTDRRLTPLTNYDLYCVLLDAKELIEEYKYLNILLCWECTALLRRTQIFRQRLQRAQYTLAHDKQMCYTLSTLKHDHKQDYDYIIEETIELKPDIDQFLVNHVEIDIKEDIDKFETDNHFENYDVIIVEQDKIKKGTKNLKNKKQREKQDLKKIDNGLDLNNPEDIDNFETDNHFENYDNYEEDKIKKVTKNVKNKKHREKQDMKKIDNILNLNNPEDIDNFETDNHFENYDNKEKIKIKKVTKYKKKKEQRERQELKKIDNGLDLNNPDNYFNPSCLSEMEIKELLERERDDRDSVSRPEKCATCGFRFASKTELYDHRRIDHRRRSAAIKCPHCALPYRTHWELELHCWRLHPVNRCTLCGRVVARDKDRAKHLEQHKYRYRCVKCDVDFENKQLFAYHQKELHSKYICAHCGHTNAAKKSLQNHIYYINGYTLRSHIKYVHEKIQMPKTKICSVCGRGFATNRVLENHMRTHTGERPFACAHCAAAFAQRVALKSHLAAIHKEKTHWELELHCWRLHPVNRCTLCGRVVARDKDRAKHLEQHKYRYRCVKCDVDFENKQLFAYHQKELHSKYICAHCGHTNAAKKSLQNHIVRHHLPSKCPHCPLIFPTSERLSRHTRSSHARPGEEAYCVECDVSFPNRARYNRHLSQAQRHRPRKKISVPCPECGKIFSRKNYMTNHMKLFHSKQSRHHCQLCDKYYINGYTLRSHIKYVHEKIQMPKTKICSVCGRGFATNRVLENHMRTHTGERPFACAHCAAAFAQRVALKSHLAAIHKEK